MVRPQDLPEHNRKRRESSARVQRETRRFGGDLVQLTMVDDPCPECLRVQGKLFSITGHTPGFPKLTKDVIPPICEEGCRCRRSLKTSQYRSLENQPS
jgi:hypothetical protein